jgi:sugar lactone lactonase YvrE
MAGASGAIAVWRWTRVPAANLLADDWRPVVRVLAGTGVPGNLDGDAHQARFSDPFGVASASDGAVFIADGGAANRIRRIAPDGTVTTVAASEGGFDAPSGLAFDPSGALYVADTGNNAIRRVAPDGTVTTIAGSGAAGYLDGPAAEAQFNGPVGIAVDKSGRIFVADTYNDRIRVIDPSAQVWTLAGTGHPGAMDGRAVEASFDTPSGIAVDKAGTIFVADTGNGAVRAIAPDGTVTTVGPLPDDGLFRPIGIAAAGDRVLYVTDDRGRIVEIVPGVRARVLAGSRPGFADGDGQTARFRSLAGIAASGPGRLVVCDSRNALVRVVAAPARLGLLPPAPTSVAPAFDAEAFRELPLFWPLAPMDGPFEITGTLGELRGGEGGERFHAGLDIHASEGTPVLAVRDGTVSGPAAASEFGTLNESVRIGALTYVHVRVGRDRSGAILDPSRFVGSYDDDGKLVRVRVRRGARFRTGEVVGSANAFNHVHLNVGWPGEEYNPLAFSLLHFEDSVPPAIARGGVVVFGEGGQRLTARRRGRLVVSGTIHIVVDAWDQVDGNEPRRRLGVYRLGYQILDRSGRPMPGFERPLETIRFDRMIPGSEAARLAYASGSGIPFYGRRRTRFLYVVTNRLEGGVATAGGWDSSSVAPGDYILRVLAEDIRGNAALANRDVPITVGSDRGQTGVRQGSDEGQTPGRKPRT